MKPLQRQRGVTAIAVILMLAVGAFFVAVVLTLFPIYMEHFSVKSHLKGVKEEAQASNLTDKDIMKGLMRRFDIDNVKHVTEDNIDIEQTDDGARSVVIEYEVRDHFLANIDIVAKFHDEVKLPSEQAK